MHQYKENKEDKEDRNYSVDYFKGYYDGIDYVIKIIKQNIARGFRITEVKTVVEAEATSKKSELAKTINSMESKYKKEEHEIERVDGLIAEPLEDGNCYIFSEKNVSQSIDIADRFMDKNEYHLVIIFRKRDDVKKLLTKYSKNISTIRLSTEINEEELSPIGMAGLSTTNEVNGVEQIISKIEEISQKLNDKKMLIFFVGLEYIVSISSIDKTVKFLNVLIEKVFKKSAILILSADPTYFSDIDFVRISKQFNKTIHERNNQ